MSNLRRAATAEEYAGLFQTHYAKGEHEQAAQALEAALRLRPDWNATRYNPRRRPDAT